MSETILSNAKIVLGNEVIHGSIAMSNGVITAIDHGHSVPVGATDCEGDYVMPGLIELHTDNLERHIQPRPKVDWPHTNAIMAHDSELASVGITTVFDALRVGSIVSENKTNYGKYARKVASELLELHSKGALRISHKIHLRAEICSETLTEELAEFTSDDRVGIVSMMDHTPGQRQFRDLSKLKEYVVGKHGLSDEAFLSHVENQVELRARLGDAHESAILSTAKRLNAVLASHDDTTEGHVNKSAQNGIKLAEFPTTQEAARFCRTNDIFVMMGGPNLIRGGSHSGNVSAEELANDRLLDILSSDYIPSSLLSASILLGDIWGDIAKGISTVTRNPAFAVDLHDRGEIALDKRADLIRVRRMDSAPKLAGMWVEGLRVG